MTDAPELAAEGKTRVQVELHPREVARMNWIMEACGIDSRKDLFNNATSVLEWVVSEVVRGRLVASFDDAKKERRILSMPILANAARFGEQHASPPNRVEQQLLRAAAAE